MSKAYVAFSQTEEFTECDYYYILLDFTWN